MAGCEHRLGPVAAARCLAAQLGDDTRRADAEHGGDMNGMHENDTLAYLAAAEHFEAAARDEWERVAASVSSDAG